MNNTIISRGQRLPLADSNLRIGVVLSGIRVDVSCFGLNAQGKLSDERYSDGGVHQNREIKALMVEASHYPIFWQFMGLGGRNYGILEKLDTMSGRVIDNCGFFAIDDLHDLTDTQLYAQLLQEFPLWLQCARIHGIVR